MNDFRFYPYPTLADTVGPELSARWSRRIQRLARQNAVSACTDPGY